MFGGLRNLVARRPMDELMLDRPASRPATIQPFDVFTDVLIRNASRGGIMGECRTMMQVGRLVHVSIDGVQFYPGIVRWVKDKRFGLEWVGDENPLDASDDETIDAPRGRTQRIPLKVRATMAAGGATFPAHVLDMSDDGMLVELEDDLRRGQHVLIGVGERPLRRCKVSWRDGNTGALSYFEDGSRQLVAAH